MKLNRLFKSYRPYQNKPDLFHFILITVFMLLSAYFTYYTIAFLESFKTVELNTIQQNQLLYQQHNIFGPLTILHNISNWLIFVSIGLIMVRILLKGYHAAQIFRRLLFVLIIMLFIRLFLLLAMTFPYPDVKCILTDIVSNNFIRTFKLFLYQDLKCDKVIFSWHATLSMAMLMLYLDYPLKLKQGYRLAINTVVSLITILGMLNLILSDSRYSMDVMTSIFGYFVVWRFYHLIVDGYGQDRWYAKVINWFDGKNLIENIGDETSMILSLDIIEDGPLFR